MSKAKYAVVWRESVYKSHRCPKCGTRLIDALNQPTNVKELPLSDRTWLFCKTCGLHVAYVAPYNGPLKPGTMGGYWNGGKPI